jgi:hypothetical protein
MLEFSSSVGEDLNDLHRVKCNQQQGDPATSPDAVTSQNESLCLSCRLFSLGGGKFVDY